MNTLREWLEKNNAFSWGMRSMSAACVVIGFWGVYYQMIIGVLLVAMGAGLWWMDQASKRMLQIARFIHEERAMQEKLQEAIDGSMSQIHNQIKIEIAAKHHAPPPQ